MKLFTVLAIIIASGCSSISSSQVPSNAMMAYTGRHRAPSAAMPHTITFFPESQLYPGPSGCAPFIPVKTTSFVGEIFVENDLVYSPINVYSSSDSKGPVQVGPLERKLVLITPTKKFIIEQAFCQEDPGTGAQFNY